MNKIVEQKLSQLPTDAGVYLMKNKKGAIIYVGKAKNLRNRVSSYFHSAQQHTSKTRALVAEITDFDLMLTMTEVEALLLERTLIRHHKPYFNILLRDDKEYPFIRVCLEDPWPRLEKVRRRKDDGAHYIGPFGSASQLSVMLRQVYRIFPLIRCSPHEFRAATRPCNYYHMKMCLGPCTLPVDRDVYISLIKSAMSLLEGNVSSLLSELKKKMRTASQAERYEEAALLRDQLKAVEQIGQNQVAILTDTVDADIIGIAASDSHIAFHVLTVRQRTLLGGDHFIVPTSPDSLQEALESFILQYYANRVTPARIIVGDTTDLSRDLGVVISQGQAILSDIVMASRGEERDLLDIAEKNATHQLESAVNVKQQAEVGLMLLQEALSLPRLPERIECIDISNLGAMAIVASDVCFIHGKAAKEFYRRYEIKTVEGAPDDFASIREVVQRRLERGLRDDDLPDLLIIDGGRPQVQAAMQVVSQFPQLGMPLVGLAKSRNDKGPRDDSRSLESSKERLVLPDREEPIELEEGSPVFRLVTRIRDEAHRFAITYHRKKRQGIAHRSILDEIPGIGPTLKKRLLIEFGSVESLRAASLERLQNVKGLNEKAALNLFTALHQEQTS